MTKTVFNREEIELLDGTVIVLHQLTLAAQRQAMKRLTADLPEADEENEDPFTNRLLEVTEFVIQSIYKNKTEKPEKWLESIKDREVFEDIMDMETMKYILKSVLGFDLDVFLTAALENPMEIAAAAAKMEKTPA